MLVTLKSCSEVYPVQIRVNAMGVWHKNTECEINETDQNGRQYKALTQQAYLKANLMDIPAKHVSVHAKMWILKGRFSIVAMQAECLPQQPCNSALSFDIRSLALACQLRSSTLMAKPSNTIPGFTSNYMMQLFSKSRIIPEKTYASSARSWQQLQSRNSFLLCLHSS